MRRLLILLLSMSIMGCVVKYTPNPQPNPPKPVDPVIQNSAAESVRLYCQKASNVFAEAAVMLKRDRNVQAVHDYLLKNLSSGRSESFKGMDNRLQEVLGAENPDIDKGVDLLNKISQEFLEGNK